MVPEYNVAATFKAYLGASNSIENYGIINAVWNRCRTEGYIKGKNWKMTGFVRYGGSPVPNPITFGTNNKNAILYRCGIVVQLVHRWDGIGELLSGMHFQKESPSGFKKHLGIAQTSFQSTPPSLISKLTF